jgi:hypothetical protein
MSSLGTTVFHGALIVENPRQSPSRGRPRLTPTVVNVSWSDSGGLDGESVRSMCFAPEMLLQYRQYKLALIGYP